MVNGVNAYHLKRSSVNLQTKILTGLVTHAIVVDVPECTSPKNRFEFKRFDVLDTFPVKVFLKAAALSPMDVNICFMFDGITALHGFTENARKCERAPDLSADHRRRFVALRSANLRGDPVDPHPLMASLGTFVAGCRLSICMLKLSDWPVRVFLCVCLSIFYLLFRGRERAFGIICLQQCCFFCPVRLAFEKGRWIPNAAFHSAWSGVQ